MFKTSTFLIKISNSEYWPMWVLYVPVFIQHFWLSLKAKSLFFFLKTNPGIDGFILSDSKFKTLQLVPDDYLPKTISVPKDSVYDDISRKLKNKEISYPIVLKPDIGYRGLLVSKIDDEAELRLRLEKLPIDYIIQEYVDYPVEIGVFYYRFPNSKKGVIPSVTLKDFLSLTGDGKKTFQQLVYNNPRAYLQKEKLSRTFENEWDKVVPQGKVLLLEAIGNHNRGTKFLNGNHLIDSQLVKVFDDLCAAMPEFYYGRFDIRTRSVEDLRQGKRFKILEVNGVGAEPTHIYDPGYKLTDGWKDMLHIWKVTYKIAMQNKEKGEVFPKYAEAKRRWNLYRDYKRVAF
ncbi:hypothetical protein MQE36_10830 [Zhouia spongiae]|uniref:D-alanine--D-alanine ligase n=1 Tax=Zhouia spongiae TaxID=2202721 RepID=A0ABY3YK90_9FLAO|nr:hypothetical protein [Zhouia spongiae]UNY97578.1 hypothetical protein MQE36_10830 [Zhouia spongiae]